MNWFLDHSRENKEEAYSRLMFSSSIVVLFREDVILIDLQDLLQYKDLIQDQFQ
jgi:hypothetical protein